MPLIIKLILLLLATSVALCLFRTLQLEGSEKQQAFLKGTVPNPPLNGFYSGSVSGPKVSWLGKRFNADTETGINMFANSVSGNKERFPFKTYTGKSVRGGKTDVLTIDYNLPENPFWLRFILDEIVEATPGQYLGKLHVLLIPGYPFTLAFFELAR
jgi:hypothetical protein